MRQPNATRNVLRFMIHLTLHSVLFCWNVRTLPSSKNLAFTFTQNNWLVPPETHWQLCAADEKVYLFFIVIKMSIYFLRFINVGTLHHNLRWLGHSRVSCGWRRDVSCQRRAYAESALPGPMAGRPWQSFVETGRQGGICMKRTSPIKRSYFLETEEVYSFCQTSPHSPAKSS